MTVIAGVPILGTIFVTASTSEPDLSELSPIDPRANKYALLDWSVLLQDHSHVLKAGPVIPSGAEVQAMGYMMAGDQPVRKGEWIQDFLLLPEAGSLLHPAHRNRDQMIAIHLEDSARIQFTPGALVWARGNFRVSSGLGARPEALYILERARVKPADRTDIKRYFK